MKKKDVLEFYLNYEEYICSLHYELKQEIYRHSNYSSFYVCDPKQRHINKAKVKDRLLHQAVINILEPIFDKRFIYDSYSSRVGKGTHKAMDRFNYFAWKLSANNTKTVWVLKCDIRKFFDSIDQIILERIVQKYIKNTKVRNLLHIVFDSFHKDTRKGLPLGNLTSQLFSNVFMNEFDQFMKHNLQVKYYIRYADDFVVLSQDKMYLENILLKLEVFLNQELKIYLHPNKVSISTWHSGVDFLGFVHFPLYKLIRTKTKKRAFVKFNIRVIQYKNNIIDKESFNQTKASYLSLFKHGRNKSLIKKLNLISKS